MNLHKQQYTQIRSIIFSEQTPRLVIKTLTLNQEHNHIHTRTLPLNGNVQNFLTKSRGKIKVGWRIVTIPREERLAQWIDITLCGGLTMHKTRNFSRWDKAGKTIIKKFNEQLFVR